MSMIRHTTVEIASVAAVKNSTGKPMWGIFQHPKEYPEDFVGKLYDRVSGLDTGVLIRKERLEDLVNDIKDNTEMKFYPRGKEDEECLLGVYV